MVLKTFLVLLIFQFPLLLAAQLTLEIADVVDRNITPNFVISHVVDSTESTTLGNVYLADKKRTIPVKLSMGVDTYFEQLAQQILRYPRKSDSISLSINNLSLQESESDGILKGSLRLTISYSSKYSDGELFLIKKTSNVAYRRTFGSATPKSFEKLLAKAFHQNIEYFSSWKTLNQGYHPAFIIKSNVVIRPPFTINTLDTVYYENGPISWGDFKGKPMDARTNFAAAIFPNIAFDLEMELKNQTLTAYFTPKVYMVQGMSWVKDNSINDYALAHEQLHFDIAKIAMNRMIKRVKMIEATTPEDLQSRIQFEYLEAYREMNRLQKAYDDETMHGVNRMIQNFWKSRIQAWLKE